MRSMKRQKNLKTPCFPFSLFSTSMAFAILALSSPTYASSEFIEDDIELQDSYVRPDYVEIERMRNTKEIIVIPKEDIQQKGKRTISDVLNSVSSINVNTTGMGDIDIRGQGADQSTRNIQVLLDGAPITTLVNHPSHTNYDVVPVEQLERIEVIPGGGSVLYGSGASGGIVNITTNLRAMSEPQSTLSAEYNSKGYRVSGNLGGTFDDKRFAYDLSYSHLDRDLYFVDTFRQSDYFAGGLRWNLTDSQSVVLRYSRLEEESQYLGNVSLSKIEKFGENYRPNDKEITIGLDNEGHKITKKVKDYLIGDRQLDTINISYLNDISSTLHLSSDLFYNDGYYIGIDDENKRMDHDGHGIRTKLDWNYYQDNQLLVGLDYTRQKAGLAYNNYKYKGKDPSGEKIYEAVPLHYNYDKGTYAIFALNTIKWEKFEFSQGLRRELTKWQFDKADTTEGQGSDQSDRWNSAFELSAAYNYRDTGRFYIRYERGYTVPDGLQITDSIATADGKVMSATKAEDEIFDMYEVGLRDQIGFSTISLTAWMSETNNQMNRFLYLTDDGLTRQTMNLLKSRRWGADLVLTQTFGRLSLEESYSYTMGRTRCRDAQSCEFLENKNISIDYASSGLQKVPKHKASIKATYNFNDDISISSQYTRFGSYNNFMKNSDEETGGVFHSYGLLDLSMHWKAQNWLDIYAGITNVMNEEYWEYQAESASTYSTVIPGAKRAFFIGLKGIF